MSRRSVWARIKRIWVIFGITATIIFVGWSLVAYRANTEARAAAVGDADVSIVHEDGVWRFTAANAVAPAPVGFLFFAGALVDPRAYAPLARAVAAAGYPAVLMELPRRGAFGGANDPGLVSRARDQMASSGGGPRRWVIAGHSRGAVVASDLAATRAAEVVGVVLMGTTHPRDVDLSSLAVPITKLIGTEDGIAPESKSIANRHLLPATVRWVRIEGGNHSQFGWYGFQPGDHFPRVTATEQHAQTLQAVLDMLRRVAESAAQ